MSGYAISNLKAWPEFAATVSDRIWKAWWQAKGTPLSLIEGRVNDNLSAGALPFALVAHNQERFLATASVIVSDCEERPALSPWVAAVWVEPEARSQGIGRTIVTEAAQAAFALGHENAYLCALPELESFYTGIGWQVAERDVDGDGLIVFSMTKAL